MEAVQKMWTDNLAKPMVHFRNGMRGLCYRRTKNDLESKELVEMKLYIRYKKDGKWTWRPVTGNDILNGNLDTDRMKLVSGEEE